MIGLEFFDKETGIFLFSYEFRPDILYNSEIRSGLLTAILNIMQETFGTQSSKTRNITYGKYSAILAEGNHLYGVLFCYQTGPIYEQFLYNLVERFETIYQKQLEEVKINYQIPTEFEKFNQYIRKEYDTLLQVDVLQLSRLLELIQSYNEVIFDNMLIFSRPEMNQIYTDLGSEFSKFSEEISNTIKVILELSVKTEFTIEHFEIALSPTKYCLMFNISPYSIILFIDKKQLEFAKWRIKETSNTLKR
ncbi:hypothetical protein [Candidatus Hodarchaeum mangrovi]